MVCLVTFTDDMEVLKRVAKDHSKNIIENISVEEKTQKKQSGTNVKKWFHSMRSLIMIFRHNRCASCAP